MSTTQNNHILIFPYPAQGHILPLLDLTHQLALRNLFITIIVTPKNLPTLTQILSAHPATINTLVLPFPCHPNIPIGLENVRDIGNHGNVPFINALVGLQEPIIQWFKSQSQNNCPVAVIADHFLGWTTRLAACIGIPVVSFSSSSAFLAALADDCWLRLRCPRPPCVVCLPDLPGKPEFAYEQMPSLMRRCRESSPETDLVTESFLAGVSPEVIVAVNTFNALEGKYLNHLRKRRGAGRVFAVGPLSLLKQADRPCLAPEVVKWLDVCSEGSVVYVCFGSQKVLSVQQMEAIALGLELSGVMFVWVVNPGSSVPEGFEKRVERHGLVIKGWAPQAEILGHHAIGGFLSHCGWNSTLEAVSAGVRILAWPMEADQHINARLLVEDIGVAVRVCEGADTVPDPNKLAKLVSEAMAPDAPEKARAEVLRDKALAAVKQGGTSSNELDEFVSLLKGLPKPVVSM